MLTNDQIKALPPSEQMTAALATLWAFYGDDTPAVMRRTIFHAVLDIGGHEREDLYSDRDDLFRLSQLYNFFEVERKH